MSKKILFCALVVVALVLGVITWYNATFFTTAPDGRSISRPL